MISRQKEDRNQKVQQVERLGAKQAFVVSHVGADEAKHAVVEQSVDLIGGHPRKQQLEGFQHHSTIDQRVSVMQNTLRALQTSITPAS